MRIVYIITRMDELGGPQIHLRDFSTLLISQGHDVHIIAGTDGFILDSLRAAGIPCYIVPDMTRAIGLRREIRAIRAVAALLKTIKPDLVSCHSSKAGVVGRIAAKMAKCKSIFTVHGWAFTENVPPVKRAIYTAIEWIMARFCARIITVSDYDRALGLRAFIARPEKIITVHNGMIDYPAPERPVAEKGAPVRLIMVARFAPQKDYALLINAMADLKKYPNWTLDLVGNGDTTDVTKQINDLGLSDRINVLGERKDVNDLLNQSDIFLLITHYEGFPRSIIEAMRARLPVIATDVSGIPESVHTHENGFLVRHGSRTSLVPAIEKLINDPALRIKMGNRGREMYDQGFTFQHMFDKTLAVYKDVIKA